MPTQQKLDRVATLKERIEGSQALLLTEYRGLTVHEITELRGSLREADASFAVVKNTLMQRAAAEAGLTELEALLEGPSAVAFVSGDPVAAAKKVSAASKQFPALVLKGGWMEGKVLDADQAKALASLDSREEMLSKIAGLMKAEMSRAASMFVGAQSRFVGLLEALKEKLPGEAEPEPEADASSEPEAEAATEVPEAESEPEAEAEPVAEADAETTENDSTEEE
jgi:large subunit ribosomal protein L10